MTTPVEPLTARGRRTRDGLLVAAAEVFAERGYAATRMQDVALAAGVSHGTVYTWFAAKDDLLRAVADQIVAEVLAGAGVRDRSADPVARLWAANRRFLAAFRRHARMLAVVEEAASADPSWAGALDRVRGEYAARAERVITRLQRVGLAAPDVPAGPAAHALTGMVETVARRGDDLDLDAATDLVTRLYARALGLTVPTHA